MGSPPDAARRRFEQLVAQVYEPLQRFLLRRTDPATADDVLGDVLLVLWRRLDDVPVDLPLPWAYGVARKCLANSRRAAVRREQLVRRVAAQRPADAADDDGRLAEALALLAEDDRELLRLWAWEQLPPREIATVLGVSANAAAIRLHRAKRRLRGLMDGKEGRAAGHEGLHEEGRTR